MSITVFLADGNSVHMKGIANHLLKDLKLADEYLSMPLSLYPLLL